jgi:NO-binding membrane sensor protein with MHYT domain
VLLAISLFWLALAEIGGKRLRLPTLLIGGGVYGLGLALLAVVEVLFFILRGGVL